MILCEFHESFYQTGEDQRQLHSEVFTKTRRQNQNTDEKIFVSIVKEEEASKIVQLGG